MLLCVGWVYGGRKKWRGIVEANLDTANDTRARKTFISHSSLDRAYVRAFVELLEDIGMPDGSIVCSSVSGYGVPVGEDIFDWLRSQFVECDLHVVYALSSNYYQSPASLNEMGAAWLARANASLLLLPGFDFGDIKGCVSPRIVGIKLDGPEDELKVRLGELKDAFVEEFSLAHLAEAKWERRRDEFIDKVRKAASETDNTGSHSPDVSTDSGVQPVQSARVVALPAMPNTPVEPALLLVYAASSDGQILCVKTMGSGTVVSAAGKSFNADATHRESARWVEALGFLVAHGWVKPMGNKGQVYEVTGTGYKVSDVLKDGMGIDTTRDPREELKEFE